MNIFITDINDNAEPGLHAALFHYFRPHKST